MTKIKFCGLTRPADIETANLLRPDCIGFVFARKSRRYIDPAGAALLKALLDPEICAVGVFVDEAPEKVAALLEAGIIDMAQLHGKEDACYIERLRTLTDRPILQAFRVRTKEDVLRAADSSADHILLDAGAGTGTRFDWGLIREVGRPYFLAGGLSPSNIEEAVRTLRPYGADVSSGIETDGYKDKEKMAAFMAAVRKAEV